MRTAVASFAIIILYIARHLLANAVVELFKAALRVADRVGAYFAKSIWNLLKGEKRASGPLPHDDNTPIEPT